MNAARAQQHVGRDRLQTHKQLVTVLEGRIQRRQELLAKGHIARDAYDVEFAALMNARSTRAEIEQYGSDLDREIRALQQRKGELKKQHVVDEIEHRISVERLQRDIVVATQQVSGEYRSTVHGFVAHLFVDPGQGVHKGQVLAKLRRSTEQLEAWLYVSTAQARMLQTGQAVEIRLDAYPQQIFGTFTATVTSVSGVALLPREVTAPLQIHGPVFEVRAVLNDNSIAYGDAAFALQPGISFKADIVQSRLRLYEWMLHSLRKTTTSATIDDRI